MLSRQFIGRTLTWMQSRTLLFNSRRNKYVFIGGFAILCLLYLASSYLRPAHRRFASQRHFETCLDRHLSNLEPEIAAGDMVVKHGSPRFMDVNFLAMIGNGHFSLTLTDKIINAALFSNDSTKSLPFPFTQMLAVSIEESNFDGHDAVILNLKSGSIHHLDSWHSRSGGCLVAEHILFAHRSHPNVVLQKIVVSNYGKFPVKMRVYQTAPSKKFTVAMKQATSTDEEAKEYAVVSGIKKHGQDAVKFVAISSNIDRSIEVSGFMSSSVTQLMLLDAKHLKLSDLAEHKSKQDENTNNVDSHVKKAEEAYAQLVNRNKALLEEHASAMKEVWNQRINVESKDDPNTPSAVHVYLTEYYLALSERYNNSRTKGTEINGKTGDCYSGSETMHSADLWVLPTSVDSLMTLKGKWMKQLVSSGCSQLVKAGFYGFQEAVSLSFSGLKFTPKSLQLAINPLSLMSNVSLHHVYSYNHFINIKIEISPGKFHQVVRVQVDGALRPSLCACGAGCKNIVTLQNVYMTFPVLVTAPVTPILYISSNRSDLEIIQKRSFIIQASQGLSSDDRTRSGEHLKLSPKFWVAISVLVIGFHMIVVKMIYNECRKDKGRRPGKGFAS